MTGNGRWTDLTERSRSRGVRLLITTALALGLFGGPIAGTVAQSESTFSYDEEGLVFTVGYDADTWVVDDVPDVPLVLTALDDSGAVSAQAGFITNLQLPYLEGDLGDCLQSSIVEYEAGYQVVEAATLTDDDSNLIQGEGDGYAFEARSNTSTINGSEEDSVALALCVALGDGNNLSVRIFHPGENVELADSYDVLGAITVNGEALEIDFTPVSPDADDRPLAGGGAGAGFPGGASWNVSWVEPWVGFDPGQPGTWVQALDDAGDLRAQGLFLASQDAPELAAADAAGCLQNAFAIYEDGDPNIAESSTLVDANGDEIAGSGDNYAYEGRANSGTVDGEAFENSTIHACWSFGDGQVLWGRVFLPPGSDGDDLQLAYDLLDEVAINRTPVIIDFPDAD